MSSPAFSAVPSGTSASFHETQLAFARSTNTFTSAGGTLVIATSGTAFTTSAGRKIGVNVIVNGVTNGVCSIYANPISRTWRFVPYSSSCATFPLGQTT